MKPFWRYYGGKYMAAPKYPAPLFGTIIEPFAGAAGYSMRYPDRQVILVDKYPVVCEVWRYLIGATPAEILSIPCVDHVDDLPGRVPQGGRWLVGFCLSDATTSPRKSLSAGRKARAHLNRIDAGWTERMRERVASQVDKIKHWRIIEGDWYQAPARRATWYVDPPYNNAAGSHYVHGPGAIDFDRLGKHCREVMPGQVIACENDGATWLPFRPFATFKTGIAGNGATAGSKEVIWTRGCE